MNSLPVGKDKFDFIFSRFSLMYLENMNQLIKDLSNSLSDEGEFLADEITIDESNLDGDKINFSYAIFKVKKEEDKEYNENNQ